MPISLTHLSEPIFAAMVNARREAVLSHCGLLELADLDFVRAAPSIATCEVALDAFGGRSFDGASQIDTVIRLRSDLAAPFELKLGTTRLSKTRVDDEWLTACTPSHGDRRWKGNMMAILDRRFDTPVVDDLRAKIDGGRVTLTREWFVVARRETLAAWKISRPAFSAHVRFCAFEDIVAVFGGADAFNGLVGRLLDVDFYREWVLGKGEGC